MGERERVFLCASKIERDEQVERGASVSYQAVRLGLNVHLSCHLPQLLPIQQHPATLVESESSGRLQSR